MTDNNQFCYNNPMKSELETAITLEYEIFDEEMDRLERELDDGIISATEYDIFTGNLRNNLETEIEALRREHGV